MPTYMSQVDYAKHRGISQPRISALISSKQIPDSCIKKIGKYNRIDRDLADAALEQNLDQVRNRPTREYGKKKRARAKNPTTNEKAKAMSDAGVEMRSLSEAQTVTENYKAFKAELDYKKAVKELIPAAEAERAMKHIVMIARGEILGRKAKFAALLKEFVKDPEDFGTLLELVDEYDRETLRNMADASKVD